MCKRAGGAVLVLILAVGHAALGETGPGDQVEHAGCHFRTVAEGSGRVASLSARCDWSVPPSRVIAVLSDPEGAAGVLSAVQESRLLPDGRLLQVHSLGWPIADRQVTLDWNERHLPDGGLTIDFGRSARQEPLGAGRVQILEDEGRWEVRAGGEAATELRYRVRYDAGGQLDPRLVRRFQRDGVARSLEEVRRAAHSLPDVAADASGISPP